jgi:superfamily II DNA or RNA helicase
MTTILGRITPTNHVEPQPQLIEEVESLLGRPFSESADDYSVSDYTTPGLGLALFTYQATCRILAEARREDREVAQLAGSYEPQTFNQQWRLTSKKIGEISFRYHDRIQPLARHLALVQNAQRYTDQNWQELTPRLNKDQQEYVLDIIGSLRRAPRMVRYTDLQGFTDNYPVHGTTVIAPTGFGKTRLIEALAKIFYYAGQLEDSQPKTETDKTVVVCPSHIIQRQNIRALEKQLPEVSIGTLNGRKREFDAAIVVSTIDSTRTYLENNMIGGRPVGALLVDEGHHLTEPGFKQTFVQEWNGPSVVFTATPAYDLTNDVRRILPHIVEHTDLLHCVEKETLSDAEIYTLDITRADYLKLLEHYGASEEISDEFDQERAIIDRLVIDSIIPWLEEGRRGIIFCEPGGQSLNATLIAKRLSKLSLSTGKLVVAKSIDSFQNNQDPVLKDYEAGRVDIITSVAMGREGMDAIFDFVVLNRNLTSRLLGSQIFGRGMRRSSLFAVTKYLQIVNRIREHKGDRLYSMEEAFGNTEIIQGGRPREAGKSHTKNRARPADFSDFPDLVAKMLARINYTPLGQTFVGANRLSRARDKSYIRLPDILHGYVASELYAKKLLLRKRFDWQGKIEKVDGVSTLIRSYSPEAQTYLRSVLPKGRALQIKEVAQHFGVTIVRIKTIVGNPAYDIIPKDFSGRVGRPKKVYDDDHLDKIARILAKDKADEPPATAAIPEVADEQKNQDLPVAGQDEKYLKAIAADLGIHWQVVKRNLTAEEWAAAILKRYHNTRHGKYSNGWHWSSEDAANIATRLRKFISRPLPAHLVPKTPLTSLVRVGKGSVPMRDVENLLHTHGYEFEEILIVNTRSFSNCLPWAAVAILAQTYGRGLSEIAKNIDYERLPQDANDLDPDRIAYAQFIQRQFMDTSKLKKY